MTVIAWDGTTLAADKQSTNCGHPAVVTKIYRVGLGLVAFSGCASHAMELLEWFRAGAVRADWPKPRDGDGAGALLITNDRQIHLYNNASPYCEHLEQHSYARGAGRDYALAAMALGKSAREAVELACLLDISCGMGVDTLTFD